MFLIAGINPVKRPGAQNIRRYCPRCNDPRNFQEFKYRHYFTFFFIPIFPVSLPSTFFTCSICGYTVTAESADDALPISETFRDIDIEAETMPKIIIFCSRCDGPMSIPVREYRQTVTCPHCALEFVVKSVKGDIPPAKAVPHT
ncbi:MAG: zinc-ribbon domain-containing protein [Firmicutes bacterium]|nr:zinc-ribbon domain-containing protein [Bacillota bacterium]